MLGVQTIITENPVFVDPTSSLPTTSTVQIQAFKIFNMPLSNVLKYLKT